MVPCCRARCRWAGMSLSACPVEFTSGYGLKSDTRPFGAPDRPVAIPDSHGGAGESGTGCRYSNEQVSKDRQSTSFTTLECDQYLTATTQVYQFVTRRDAYAAAIFSVAQWSTSDCLDLSCDSAD